MKNWKFLYMFVAIVLMALLTTTCEFGTEEDMSADAGNPKSNLRIYTVEDLVKLATMGRENPYPEENVYELMNDIDLTDVNWIPIGSMATPFKGTFKGNGYTISGFKLPDTQYSGLFGIAIGKNEHLVRIENLKIEVVETTLTNSRIARFGVLAAWVDRTEIENVFVSGEDITISAPREIYVGGIIGNVSGTIFGNTFCYVNITNCASDISLSVTFTSNNGSCTVGGIIGNMDIGENSIITSCYTKGDITATNNNYVYSTANANAGGIVGQARNAEISSCYSKGEIEATARAGRSCAGGITGHAANTTIERCVAFNSRIAAESSNTSNYYLGRISGYVQSATFTNNIADKNTSLQTRVWSWWWWTSISISETDPKHGIAVDINSLTETVYCRTGTVTVRSSDKRITGGGLSWSEEEWDFTPQPPELKWLYPPVTAIE